MGNTPDTFFNDWQPAYKYGWLRVSSRDYLSREAWEEPSGGTRYVDAGKIPMIRYNRLGYREICPYERQSCGN